MIKKFSNKVKVKHHGNTPDGQAICEIINETKLEDNNITEILTKKELHFINNIFEKNI